MSRVHVTRGEELYHFMCANLQQIPHIQSLSVVGDFARRTTRFLEFLDGTIRFHTFARAIQFGRLVLVRDDLPSYDDKTRELQNLCLEMLEIGAHNCDDLPALLKLILNAATEAEKDSISVVQKEIVLQDYLSRRSDLKCYMCDGPLDVSIKDQYVTDVDVEQHLSQITQTDLLNKIKKRMRSEYNPGYVEYDHVWPRSLGGDSVADNLLPICPPCNRHKTNIVSWVRILPNVITCSADRDQLPA